MAGCSGIIFKVGFGVNKRKLVNWTNFPQEAFVL